MLLEGTMDLIIIIIIKNFIRGFANVFGMWKDSVTKINLETLF